MFIATFVTGIGAKILFVSGVGGSFSELSFTGAVSENKVFLGAKAKPVGHHMSTIGRCDTECSK